MIKIIFKVSEVKYDYEQRSWLMIICHVDSLMTSFTGTYHGNTLLSLYPYLYQFPFYPILLIIQLLSYPKYAHLPRLSI